MEVQTVKVEGDRLNKENVLRDFVRLSWRATRGLTTGAEVEAKAVVKRLVDVGRVTPEQGNQILTNLIYRMQSSRRVFEKRVEGSVKTASEKLMLATTKEISRLQMKVEELEKRVERVAKK